MREIRVSQEASGAWLFRIAIGNTSLCSYGYSRKTVALAAALRLTKAMSKTKFVIVAN